MTDKKEKKEKSFTSIIVMAVFVVLLVVLLIWKPYESEIKKHADDFIDRCEVMCEGAAYINLTGDENSWSCACTKIQQHVEFIPGEGLNITVNINEN